MLTTPNVGGPGRTPELLAAVEEEIHRTLCILHDPGEVIELRAPNAGKAGTISGYFKDSRALARAAARLEGHVAGIYITAHRIVDELLARASNRVIERAKHTTSDADVVAYRWLPIDVDPVRPAGISSTDGEHEAALEMAARIADWLVAELGFATDSIVLADSGNGAHVLSRIDEPADRETAALIVRCLYALDLRWSTDGVKIDTSVSNPARIWRLYGTVSAKGDAVADRPHRRSRLLEVPKPIEVCPREALERLAALAPAEPEPQDGRRRKGEKGFDVGMWLADQGIAVANEGPWKDGEKWILAECPFAADDHGRDHAAYVVQLASGRIARKLPPQSVHLEVARPAKAI